MEIGYRSQFVEVTPKEVIEAIVATLSKANTAEQWDQIKYDIMAEVLFAKFANPDLKVKLRALPPDIYLEETNWWSDTYWGVDFEKGGENNLGKLLMKLRRFWE